MTKRDHQEESLHYLMINVLVDSLEKEGFTVNADHVGGLRKKPASVGGFTPDIEARRGGDLRLIEVETNSTIDLPETHDQIASMAAGRGTAYLAIPFDCIEGARRLRDELGVEFVILPCYPFVRYVGMPK
jgi:predicted RecB family endonuclease